MLSDLISELDKAIVELKRALENVKPEERLAMEEAVLVLLRGTKQLLLNDAKILTFIYQKKEAKP